MLMPIEKPAMRDVRFSQPPAPGRKKRNLKVAPFIANGMSRRVDRDDKPTLQYPSSSPGLQLCPRPQATEHRNARPRILQDRADQREARVTTTPVDKEFRRRLRARLRVGATSKASAGSVLKCASAEPGRDFVSGGNR